MRTSQICPTCTTYINSLCVVYNGTYLSNINVSPLDDLQKILANINSSVGVINSSIASINTSIIATNANLALKENSSNKSNGAIGTSLTLFPTQNAVKTYVDGQVTTINGNLALKENIADKVTTQATFISNGTSVIKYPSIKAVKDYIDGVTAGLLRDAGNFTPSGTSPGNLYPTSGTGPGGSIVQGDTYFIDTPGFFGIDPVGIGASIRALAAPPSGPSDWSILDASIGFVPENSANKSTDGTFNSGSPSSVLFPTQSAVATYIAANAPNLDQVLNVGAISTTPIVIGDLLVSPLESSTINAGIIDLVSSNTNMYTQYQTTSIVLTEIVGGQQMVINFNNSNQTVDFPSGSGTLALVNTSAFTGSRTINSEVYTWVNGILISVV